METKPLLFGLIGFFIGGLTVSLAATYIEEPAKTETSQMSMSEMTDTLATKKGDDFDKAFIATMIEHHEGAIEMAKLSANQAKHDEIKQLSSDIVEAQEKEISDMKHWQSDWGYSSETPHSNPH